MHYSLKLHRVYIEELEFLQGVSGSCKPCTSYDRDVCPSVRLSVRLSVRHTLTLCENDAS